MKAGLEHAIEFDQVPGHPGPEGAEGVDRTGGPARNHDPERTQIKAPEFRIIEHGDKRGGSARDERDALPLNEPEGGAGAEAIQEHGTGPDHEGLEEGQVAPVEPQGQVDEEDLVLPDLHGVVEDATRWEGCIAAVGDAFRVAGRARGEGHPHDLVGAQGLRHERRERVLAGDHLVQGDGVGRPELPRTQTVCRSGGVDGAWIIGI